MQFSAGLLMMVCAALGQAQDPAALLEQGKFAEAEHALGEVLRDHPGDVRALTLMAIALDEQKRYEDAEPFYKQALARAPGAPAVLNNAANHWMAMGRTVEAKAAYRKVVAAEPRHANANLQLAKLAAGERRGAEVLGHLDRLDARTQAEPAIRILRARALFWIGQPQAASSLAAQVNAAGDPRVEFALGMAYAEWKQYDDAERSFTQALSADATNRDVLYNLGLAALGARHFERAREVLATLLRQAPDDADALVALSRTYAEQGDLAAAMSPLVAARKAAPRRADILRMIANASAVLGFHADAAAAYDAYLKLEPADDAARRERGFSLVRANSLEEGLKDLEWYVARHPQEPAGLFELALAESVRDPDRSFARLNQLLAIKPDDAAALFSRGSMHLQLGRLEDAIRDLERALRIEPDNYRALDRLGQAYLQLDRNEAALKVLARAAELAPEDRPALMHYSQALRAAGRLDEAKALLDKFRQMPQEARRVPYGGALEFLSLPPTEQRARYFKNLEAAVVRKPNDAALQARYGSELLARGRTAEAVEAYRRSASLDPASERVAASAKALLAAGQYGPARELLEKLVANGAPSDVRLDLAIALFHERGPEQGLRELDQTPEPERKGDYFLMRAQILDAMGRGAEAESALDQGLRSAPERPDLHSDAARFLIQHRRYGEAIALLDRATRRFPDDPELGLARAIALELSRRTEDALTELKRLQDRWPEWDRTYLIRGIILNVNRNPDAARPALETAIALGADTAEAYYFLALTISETAPDDRSGASQAIARALERNTADPYIRALAGKLAYARGDYKTAIEHLAEAVRLFPDFFQAHYNLANTYRALGQEEKALAEMKEVRRLREGRTKEELEVVTPPLGEALFGVGR